MCKMIRIVTLIGLMLAGALFSACDDSDDREGVHDQDGVHEPDGVTGSSIGPQGLTEPNDRNTIVIERSGELVTRSYAFAGFDEVEASMFDVDIRQGAAFEVTIEVEKNALEHVRAEVGDGRLMLGLDPTESYQMINIDLHAKVTMPSLAALHLEMSGDSTVSGFESSGDVVLVLDLGSKLTGDLVVGNATFDLSMGSYLALNGTGKVITIAATGNSEARLEEFRVEGARVEKDSNSHVAVKSSS